MIQKDISIKGYKDNSPYRNSPSLMIDSPNGLITMNGVSKRLMAKDLENNDVRILEPNSGLHQFRGNKILEIPLNNSTNMFNRPTDKKLWNEVFTKAKLKMGGYAMPSEIMNKTISDYSRKKGGFIFDTKDRSKLLSFLERQEGGPVINDKPAVMVEEIAGTSFIPQDTSKFNDFKDWASSMLEGNDFENLPGSIKDELLYFRKNEGFRDRLSEDYAKRYMPEVLEHFEAGRKRNNPGTPSEDSESDARAVKTEAPAKIEDFKTRNVSNVRGGVQTKQYGGYTSFGDYSKSKMETPVQTNDMPTYSQGSRIRYKKGGEIKEGVIKSYDPYTRKIELY